MSVPFVTRTVNTVNQSTAKPLEFVYNILFSQVCQEETKKWPQQ